MKRNRHLEKESRMEALWTVEEGEGKPPSDTKPEL